MTTLGQECSHCVTVKLAELYRANNGGQVARDDLLEKLRSRMGKQDLSKCAEGGLRLPVPCSNYLVALLVATIFGVEEQIPLQRVPERVDIEAFFLQLSHGRGGNYLTGPCKSVLLTPYPQSLAEIAIQLTL